MTYRPDWLELVGWVATIAATWWFVSWYEYSWKAFVMAAFMLAAGFLSGDMLYDLWRPRR